MLQAMQKMRADELLTKQGLCSSRSQAKAVIMAGQAWLGTERVDKPGRLLPENADLRVDQPLPYVSRGGLKLNAFLERFEVAVDGLDVLDLGSSTGGFTDCMLQRGARSATCVDVGHGQLHGKLRSDERVEVRERLNARHLKAEDLPRPAYDLATMDLSFISLRKVLVRAWSFLKPSGKLIALIKPQFEATKKEADAGRGIIKDPSIHQRVVEEILAYSRDNLVASSGIGQMESPVKGAEGNKEFLVGWERREKES